MAENTKTQATSNYATFWQRLTAFLIDAVLLSMVLGTIFGSSYAGEGNIGFGYSGGLPTVIGAVYYVVMLANYGATLGKMAMKIKVQTVETGKNPTYVEAILREVVGKFVSALIFLLGYFWMLWDPQKQAWHDKIAKTVVVRA